jgi:methionyl-tRNA formyltransferase
MNSNQNILLIGADTPRARAYATSLERAGLGPVEGIFYGEPSPTKQRAAASEGQMLGDVWVPFFDASVADVFVRNDWPCRWLQAEKINDKECVDALSKSGASLAVFAGRGGEIVSAEVLNQGVPVLHMHPGRLPEQRGSTIIYYSILEGKSCSVSALLMDKEIDAGPVVAINAYAIPTANIDVDVIYDCAIRADTMVKVLQYLRLHNTLPSATTSEESSGRLYYVVHPLLKHIALLSLTNIDA